MLILEHDRGCIPPPITRGRVRAGAIERLRHAQDHRAGLPNVCGPPGAARPPVAGYETPS
jgi:hypothetical protein